MEELLLYFSLKYDGNFDKIFDALKSKETIDEKLRSELFETFYKSSSAKFTTLVSDNYPAKLKEISCPPFVLYYHGNLSLVDKNSVAVAGSLKPSEYEKKCTELYADELAKKEDVIITGMQEGVATIALKQAMKISDKVIAVLPCGIASYYPKQNKELYEAMCKNGLIISEYPRKLEVKKDQIVQRLRLVSGISDKVLLTETETKSKQHIIVSYALEQGKNVYAIPSGVMDKDFQGNNDLIKMGAIIVTSPKDITDLSDIDIKDLDNSEIDMEM